ncbi:MAG TPA: cadmium resistance transporter [Phycisphaerae bacterium]
MRELLSSILVAMVIFASTDLDSVVMLTVFFADPTMRARAVVMGQFLGNGALVLVSVVSGVLALSVPPEWIALLGVVPVFLGMRGFVRLLRRRREDPDVEEPAVRERKLQGKTHSQILAVALVTMAHGADNLGIYIPLFARAPGKIPVYVTVFTVMMGISMLVGHTLVKNRLLGKKIARFGQVVIPFVMVGLGVHILWGARGLLPF